MFRQRLNEMTAHNKKRQSTSKACSETKSKGSVTDSVASCSKRYSKPTSKSSYKQEQVMNSKKKSFPSKKILAGSSNKHHKVTKSLGSGKTLGNIPTAILHSESALYPRQMPEQIQLSKHESVGTRTPCHQPVNIFNFNNYNIIKNEKEKFEREKRKSNENSQKVELESSSPANVQNYFIFMHDKKGSTHKKSLQGLEGASYSEQRQLKTYHSSSRLTDQLMMKKLNLKNTSISKGALKTKASLTSLNNSKLDLMKSAGLIQNPSQSSYAPTELSKNRSQASLRAEKTKTSQIGLNEYLRFVEEQGRLVKYSKRLLSTCQASSSRIHKKLIQSMKEKYAPQEMDYFKDTVGLVEGVIQAVGDLKEVAQSIPSKEISSKEYRAQPISTISACQTVPPIPRKEVQFNNINLINLTKEIAKGFLIRSKRLTADSHNYEKNIKDWSQAFSENDAQKECLLRRIFGILQEHMIFEEALKLLKEKEVPLEEIFASAYDTLGVEGKPSDNENSQQAIVSLNVSGASLLSDQSKEQKLGPQVTEKETNNQFILNFDNLKTDSVSEANDNSLEENCDAGDSCDESKG